jgi:hypothetical protein
VESQCFVRTGLDLAEIRRRRENLNGSFEDVGRELIRETLGALARLDIRGGVAQSQENLELADRLVQ